MKRPVVGVTTYLEKARWGVWDQPAALLPQSYVDAVAKAGGIPVLLPPGSGRAVETIEAIDALVLSGGADVDPALYGEQPQPRTISRPDRDAWELALLRAALARRRPVLAVCRGMQLLNVACGGTLHQHLPDVVDNTEHQPGPGLFGINHVRITPASRLARILGRRSTVSCHHHQAVQVLGDGLGAAAWAVDETIEAIEHFEHDFVVGVQWHPEESPKDSRLFKALVHAAVVAGPRAITAAVPGAAVPGAAASGQAAVAGPAVPGAAVPGAVPGPAVPGAVVVPGGVVPGAAAPGPAVPGAAGIPAVAAVPEQATVVGPASAPDVDVHRSTAVGPVAPARRRSGNPPAVRRRNAVQDQRGAVRDQR